jgi:regulator of cell morphogenesis and NO signaling
MTESTMVHPGATLADLAANWAGASRVFQRHDLDFCCQGKRTLADACRQRRLSVDELIAELRAELVPIAAADDWRERPLVQVIAHVVDHFHAGHRAELPRLIAMAEKVERVHGTKPDCPVGLAAHLQQVAHDLEEHMQKEEVVLFPMILAGAGQRAWAPIQCMTAEHDDHGRALAKMRQLAHDYVPPPHACGTWRALYLGLGELEREVMEHVHLENHVLFPRALRDATAQA